MLARFAVALAALGSSAMAGCAPGAPASSTVVAAPTAAAPTVPAQAAKPAATAPQTNFGAGAAPPLPPTCSAQTRKLTIGVSVSPPNVVHTSPFVARALGLFGKRCIDASIVQFEGGLSQTALTAVAQGAAMGPLNESAIGQGLKGKQVWGMAPKPPQSYVVSEGIKVAADLKGKRLSAAGGGVGGFNWVMGREVLKTAGLTVDDVQFISQGTAGRLPGLVSGQLDGVALHPEDVYLAQKQKPGVHVLVALSDLVPMYYFNAYGVSDDFVARDRNLVRDAVASLMEANRAIYQSKDSVIQIMVDATDKPRDAVEFAYDALVKACVWSVNTGFNRERTEWSIQNSVNNGDIDAAKKPTYDQVVAQSLGDEALAAVGGATQIGSCKE